MKNRIMKLAQALSLLALVGFGSSAYAITITFDETAVVDGTYTWNGYVFSGVQINPGSCGPTDPSDPCINLTANTSFEVTRIDDAESFVLDSFWFFYNGATAELTLTAPDFFKTFDQDGYSMGGDGHTVTNGVDFTVLARTSYTFLASVGNIRLDDFSFDGNGTCTDCQTVPEPGTLALLGLGLLGLSVSRRRKV